MKNLISIDHKNVKSRYEQNDQKNAEKFEKLQLIFKVEQSLLLARIKRVIRSSQNVVR